MTKPRHLPWQVFELASAMLPYLDRIFESASLSPTDLFVLSHVKHFGVDDEGWGKVMLKNDVRNLLIKICGYSEGRATTILKDLQNKGLIELKELTDMEKERLFNIRSGFKPAVILLSAGGVELDNFNAKVNELFAELTDGLSAIQFKALTSSLTLFARHANKKLHRLDIAAADDRATTEH